MSALGRVVQSWPMLGSLGAGLVLIALAAGAELLPGVVLAGCGVAALGWGVLALRAGRSVAPRSTLAAGVAVLIASAALAASGASAGLGMPLLPLFAADLLVGIVALGAAGTLRACRSAAARRVSPVSGASTASRAFAASAASARPGPARLHIAGMLAGAALVAALATPALAATDAGTVAVPHGELHGPSHQQH